MAIESFPSRAGPERSQAILNEIAAGNFELQFGTVTSSHAGRQLTVFVSADALKIDGVRVNVDAATQQAIADLLGVSLLTPKLVDLIWQQAAIRLDPSPMPITSSTAGMVKHSQNVDAKLKGRAGLVANVGKDWVLWPGISGSKAANYGWLFPGITRQDGRRFGSIALGPTVSLPGIGGIQAPPGTRHNPQHVDYSQTARFARRDAILDGELVDLHTVLSDPLLAPLVSTRGVMPLAQPTGAARAPVPAASSPPPVSRPVTVGASVAAAKPPGAALAIGMIAVALGVVLAVRS